MEAILAPDIRPIFHPTCNIHMIHVKFSEQVLSEKKHAESLIRKTMVYQSTLYPENRLILTWKNLHLEITIKALS